MKKSPATWMVLWVVWSGAVAATYVRCPGCLERSRFNPACEWTGDTAARLDPRRSADWEHLVRDAQLAEELATRYADAAAIQLNGVEGHGGLIEGGAVVRACEARMFVAIEADHGAPRSRIQVARAHRNVGYDAAVLSLFVPVYWLGATLVHRGLQRRFASDRAFVRRTAAVVVSTPVALLKAQLAGLWSMLWEMIRVGNDHIGGHRLATFVRPSEQHAAALLVIGILLFWVIDLIQLEPPSNELANDSASRGPQGILLH